MKRVVSGIQATGNLHLGNYLGAMKQWIQWQQEAETLFFIPNLHSLNIRPKPAELKKETLANVAWLLAAGIDPKRATIYVQSDIPAHSEMCWILSNYVTMGELSRMTQYKDKAARRGSEGELAGLFTYPVLMAADILLYDADLVPVGADQKQHVELARDIAARFNNLHGQVFKLPRPVLPEQGARVMNLQHPERKMSKSDSDQSGNILLLDDAEVIEAKIKKAVTDSGQEISAGEDKPALSNLLQIFAATTGSPVAELENKYANQSYKVFKEDLATAVAQEVSAIQAKYRDFRDDPLNLESILRQGAERAGEKARAKLSRVQSLLGLK